MKLPPDLEARILALAGVTVNGNTPRRSIADTVSEKDFMAAVIKESERLGWKVYHTHDSRKSQAGYPDLTLARDRLIVAELKTESGRLTAAQANWLTALAEAGVECYVWRPSSWTRIVEVLTNRGEMGMELRWEHAPAAPRRNGGR